MRAKNALLPLTGLWLASAAPTQVVISEINFSTTQSPTQWIELLNLGTSSFDLSPWSLYYATQTPGQAGNYWFGFPVGTTIDSGAFVRVHWRAPLQASTKTDIYTGNTRFNFLFGYDPEPLTTIGGALALLNTQANAAMNMPGIVEEWVSWGTSGHPREILAVMNGKWAAGDFVSSPLLADSIAMIYPLNAEPTPSSAYFHDATPTPIPMAFNHPNAASVAYGTNCALGSSPTPSLVSNSIPTQGNRDFQLVVQGTRASQTVYVLMSGGQGNGSVLFGPCPFWIDVGLPFVVVGVPGQTGQTVIPVSLLDANLAGGTVFLQAAALESLVDYGFTGGLQLTLGS